MIRARRLCAQLTSAGFVVVLSHCAPSPLARPRAATAASYETATTSASAGGPAVADAATSPPARTTITDAATQTAARTESSGSSLSKEQGPDQSVQSAPYAKRTLGRDAKISARHVLVQWMGCDHSTSSILRTQDQALEIAKEVIRRARAGEDLGKLAAEFSDEPNAGARGGSLGRFGRGRMVGGFEQAAFALDVGEISDIVETSFGYHIIQRTE